MSERPIAERAGLQIERTDLAWSRTALSFAVNGGLLMLHGNVPGPTWLYYTALGLAFLLFVFTFLMARRRARALARKPLPQPLADPVAVAVLTGGTLCLGVFVGCVVLLA